MKISLKPKDYSESAKFLDVKEQNICAAEIYIEYLIEHYNDFSFAKDEKDFYSKFLECLEIDPEDKDFKKINDVCRLDKITKLDPEIYRKDEYFKVIKNINAKEGNWMFATLKYEPFEGFVWNELEIDSKSFSEHTPLGYFEESFSYPAVIQNDTIWMSIIPHEIETMKEPIKNAKGNVLVLGLGLGYYLFHVLKRPMLLRLMSSN